MTRTRCAFAAVASAAALLAACATLPPRSGIEPPLPSARACLARGVEEVEAADALRREKSVMPAMGAVFRSPGAQQRWTRHMEQAESDLRAVVDLFPASPEAPEAWYMLGRVNDHPNRNRFEEAVAFYRRAVSDHPGTAAARKAQERIDLIESIRR